MIEFNEEDVQIELALQATRAEAQRRLAEAGNTLRECEPTNQRKMPEGPDYLIDKLWPAEGYVLLKAQRKKGKTTTVLNVARSLLFREKLFGQYASHEFGLRIAWFNMEMSENQFNRWLIDTGLFDEERLYTENLRGEAKAMGIFEDKRRARLARRLKDQGINTLFVEPLGPLMRAYQMDENSTAVGELVDGLLALTTEADIPHLLVTHHQGKDKGRGARGSSVLEDTPEALWTIERDDRETITEFGAFGRDVDESANLDYDPDGRALTVTGAVRSGKRTPILKALDEADEPLSGRALFPLARERGYQGNLTTLNDDLRSLEELEEVVNQWSETRPKWERKVA